MNKYILLSFFVSLLLLGSCTKGLISFKKELDVDHFDFQYLTAKAKIRYDDGKKGVSGTANMRVEKDSAIWISLSPGLGVEVARLLISPDSIFFLDRINKNYLTLSFDQLSVEYNFKIDYNLIESIILGNLIYPYKREDLTVNEIGTSYQQIFDNFIFDNVIGNESHKLEVLNVKDLDTESTISVNYGQFQEVGEEIFPFKIKATIENFTTNKNTTSIVIGFNRAQIGDKPLKFPFDVPTRYKAL